MTRFTSRPTKSQTQNKLRITHNFLNAIRLGLSARCYYNELLLLSTPLLLLLQTKHFLFLRVKCLIFNKLVVPNIEQIGFRSI